MELHEKQAVIYQDEQDKISTTPPDMEVQEAVTPKAEEVPKGYFKSKLFLGTYFVSIHLRCFASMTFTHC